MRRQLFYIPFSITFLLFLIIFVTFGLSFLFFGVIISAFVKIGFSIGHAFLILLLSLLGSGINIPLATLRSDTPVVRDAYIHVFGVAYRVPVRHVTRNETTIAVNVGGM